MSCKRRIKHPACEGESRAIAVSVANAEAEVDRRRRGLFVAGGVFWALSQVGLLDSVSAETLRHEDLFTETTLDEALAALGSIPTNDVAVELTLPGVVEDGAVVPVRVSSSLDGIEDIYILVATNPYPVAVRFEIPEGTEPFVSIRLKLAQTGAVYAVVKAKGRLYSMVAETRVTVGGCV